MSSQEQGRVVIPLRPAAAPAPPLPPLRRVVGGVLRRERRAQGRTLQDVADAARISMGYLSEVERGRKEASSEVLAAAAEALHLGLAEVLRRVHSEFLLAEGAAGGPQVRLAA